jgi:hypothetical protein
LADDEDVLEPDPDPLQSQQVDSTSVAESLSDPFDDYLPGCAIEQNRRPLQTKQIEPQSCRTFLQRK